MPTEKTESTAADCSDREDNDGDSLSDCADPGCAGFCPADAGAQLPGDAGTDQPDAGTDQPDAGEIPCSWVDDCPADAPVCDMQTATCQPPECNVHLDCGTGSVCLYEALPAQKTCLTTCDLAAPTCPGGFACVPWHADVGTCRRVGPKAEGEACDMTDMVESPCQEGLLCDINTGTCVRRCSFFSPTNDCPAGGWCGLNQICFTPEAEYLNRPALGEPCTAPLSALSGCAPGNDRLQGGCVSEAGGLVCRERCRPGAAGDCPSGMVCNPYPDLVGAGHCQPAVGNGASAGEACTKPSDCLSAATYTCDPTTELCVEGGECRYQTDCGTGKTCIFQFSGAAVGACYDRCEPFTSPGCGQGRECIPEGQGGRDGYCLEAGTGAAMDSCAGRPSNSTGCAAGLTCANNQCLPLCNYWAAQTGCGAGQWCYPHRAACANAGTGTPPAIDAMCTGSYAEGYYCGGGTDKPLGFCITEPAGVMCRRPCRLHVAASDCPSGQSCHPDVRWDVSIGVCR